ncbi:MAG: SPOR domain-containing protein [Desulfomonile tiedjei]|nr:SPOR domain-containing protein [Desulfomonile tiedjei]
MKNGWLGLAVIGALLVMAALVLLNLRLIRDDSAPGKSAANASCPPREGAGQLRSGPTAAICENRFEAGRPQVTFYSKLMAPEDKSRPPGEIPAAAITEQDVAAPRQEVKGSEEPKTAVKPEEADRRKPVALPSKLPGSGPPQLVPSGGEAGAKHYTVQVGAFSHPGIAQQWAAKWKARGYDVSLKPVARPMGVIYRLHLGNFSSENQADDLVRHLKSKEGISALRLVVRN